MSISRRLFSLIGFTILLGIIGQWSNSHLAYLWSLPAIILLLLVMLEWLLLVTSRIDIERNRLVNEIISHSLGLGRLTQYSIRITNKSVHTIRLESQSDLPENLIGETDIELWVLAAGHSQIRNFEILPTQLGKQPLGMLYYRVLGRFGLVWWNRRFNDDLIFTVRPAGFAPYENMMGDHSGGFRPIRQQVETGTELLTMRDYRSGDPVSAIDWKATARRNKTVVRLYSREQKLEMVLLLDCGRSSRLKYGNLNRLSHYINIVSRLGQLAISNEDRIGLLTYAGTVLAKTAVDGGSRALPCLLNQLVNTGVTNEEANPLTAALDVRQLLHQRGLVVFLTHIDSSTGNTQLIKAVQLLSRKHQVLVASIEDEAINAMKTQGTLQGTADGYDNFSALEYLHNREISKRRMKQLGVTVVSAPANKIDQAIISSYLALRLRASA